ncbi:MAG: DUF4184 family protein [Terriglobales bacterium]
MPFTLAHPAAVLPLRKWLVLSALVVGSMAPDFHYFIYMGPDAEASHSLAGVFLFCLPAGLLVLWIFHGFLKLPLISLAPARHAEKLMAFAGPFPFTPLRRTMLIVASMLAGTLTHLLWDSFTHSGGWFVQRFDFLQTVVLPQIFFGRSIFSVLQHGSTLLGMAVLLLWYAKWFMRAPSQPLPTDMSLPSATKRWAGVSMAVIACALSSAYGWVLFVKYDRFPAFVGGFAIAIITVTFVEVVVFSLWWWRRRRVHQSLNSGRLSGSG